MSLPRWGSFADFQQKCEEAFQDTNKKTNAKNQLTLLRQGSKTAEEFFQEFDLLAFAAGYTDTHHDDVLIRLLHKAIHDKVIDLVYSQPTLPANYQAWKTQILAIDDLQRHHADQKKCRRNSPLTVQISLANQKYRWLSHKRRQEPASFTEDKG